MLVIFIDSLIEGEFTEIDPSTLEIMFQKKKEKQWYRMRVNIQTMHVKVKEFELYARTAQHV